MKKIMSILLLSMILIVVSNVVFAEAVPVIKDRTNFITIYTNKMITLVDLRAQTETARLENNSLTKQIKGLKTNQTRTIIENKLNQIKQVQQTNKTLLEQAKADASQRVELRQQWQAAVKTKNTGNMASTKAKLEESTSKMESIKTQIKSNKDTISPLISDIKSYRDINKAKVEQMKILIDQVKSMQMKIDSQISEKDKLWVDFSSNVKEKNYTQAITILDNIITSKQQILDDIKAKNVILNNILTAQG